MKPEGAPFFGILFALVLAAVWWWRSYDLVAFDEPDAFQFNQPQIDKDGTRFGRRAGRLSASDIERGSLVRFKTRRTGRTLTARVAAVEGERIKIEGSEITVDGSVIPDEYRRRSNADEFYPELIVPAGCVFVLTDERSKAGADRYDSRNLGPIAVESIEHVFSARENNAARSRGLR